MTRPDVIARREKERAGKLSADRKLVLHIRELLLEAAALEDRASSVSRTICTLDITRTQMLAKAAALRVEAAR